VYIVVLDVVVVVVVVVSVAVAIAVVVAAAAAAAAVVCPELGSATSCCDRLLRGLSQDYTCLLRVTYVCERKENISSTYFTSRE